MKLSLATTLLAIVCLSLSVLAAPKTRQRQTPPADDPPAVADDGLAAIPPDVADDGVAAITPDVADDGVAATPPDGLTAAQDDLSTDEPEVAADGLGGGRPNPHPKKEKLIKYIFNQNPNGYNFEYKTDLGTDVFQTGTLVKNRPYHPCPPGASVNERGEPCGPGSGNPNRQSEGEGGEDLPNPTPQPDGGEDNGPVIPDVAPIDEVPIDEAPIDEAATDDQPLSSGGPSSHKVIVMKGGFKFNTPDCVRVEVIYIADFKGFQPKVKLSKIPGCKPQHHCKGHHCKPPGASPE